MSSFEILKGWETGQIAAIMNKVSGGDREKLEALLRDEFDVQLIEKVLKFFDKNGRRIPKGLQAAVCDSNKDFHLVQPKLDSVGEYADRLVRFQFAFRAGPVMSAADFEGRSRELVDEIKNNRNLANLLNGVYLPIILPKLGDISDYGKTLEGVFLPAVKSSYERQFPDRKFYNYRENELVNNISIVSGTRHEKLGERMKHDSLVAIFFPNELQGFSILASREQISSLPKLLLSGGFDTAAAITMYPDILARDWNTPEYDLSALSWQSSGGSLDFRAHDGGLHFSSRGGLASADGYYSSGLLFLGSV